MFVINIRIVGNQTFSESHCRESLVISNNGFSCLVTILYPRQRSSAKAVSAAFLDPAHIADPFHVKFQEMDWDMAQEVFYPKNL